MNRGECDNMTTTNLNGNVSRTFEWTGLKDLDATWIKVQASQFEYVVEEIKATENCRASLRLTIPPNDDCWDEDIQPLFVWRKIPQPTGGY